MSFLLPLIGFIIGILMGVEFSIPLLSLIPVGISLAVYLYILRKSSDPLSAIKYNNWHRIWIVLLFIGIGWLSASLQAPNRYSLQSLKGFTHAEGEVTECISSAEGERIIVRIHRLIDKRGQEMKPSNFQLKVITDGYYAATGDILFFPVSLTELKDSRNYRSSGYADRMHRKGIFYNSRVSSDSIKYIRHTHSLRSLATNYRNKIEICVEKSGLQRDTKAFLAALLFGDKVNLNEEERQKFSNAGVAHILALSGTHVALIMSLLLFLTFPLNFIKWHKHRLFLCVVCIWIFTIFTGCSPSTLRASLMITLVILAFIIQRKKNSPNILFFAVFIILLFDPFSLFDVGLQLSVLSVGAIIFWGSKLQEMSRKLHPFLKYVMSNCGVTLVATASTWTVVSYYFGIIPLLFLPANLIIIPLIPFFMGASFLLVCFLIFGLHPIWLTRFIDAIYSAISWVVDSISKVEGGVLEFRVSLLIVILWMIGLAIFIYLFYKKRPNIYYYIGAIYLALVLSTVKMLSPLEKDGIIFQNYYHQISIAIYKDNNENTLIFPRRKNSEIRLDNLRILVIDTLYSEMEIEHYASRFPNQERLFLILGNGSKIDSLGNLSSNTRFDRILFHPTLYRKKEAELMEEVKKKDGNNFYSLREEGPLEIIF